MNYYSYILHLAGYPAIFSIRPDIQQVKSGIQPDTGHKKKAGLSGRITSASLIYNKPTSILVIISCYDLLPVCFFFLAACRHRYSISGKPLFYVYIWVTNACKFICK
jgi:hypothetical protein